MPALLLKAAILVRKVNTILTFGLADKALDLAPIYGSLNAKQDILTGKIDLHP
jgi:hypothetical protein